MINGYGMRAFSKAAPLPAVWSHLAACALMASISKPHRQILPDMVLVFPQGETIRTIKVLALATRRGPATEAQALYEDLDPPQPKQTNKDKLIIPKFEVRDAGAGRPTKRDRRLNDKLKSLDD